MVKNSMAASETRPLRAPKLPTMPCGRIPTRPSALPWVSACSWGIWSLASVRAIGEYTMEEAPAQLAPTAMPPKHFLRRLLIIGQNRLELLMLEVQEERERLL